LIDSMKITTSSKIVRSRSPIETTVGSEIVLMVLESGEVYGLGETGSDVWRLLEKGPVVQQLLHELAEIYDADPAVMETDVITLLEGLQEKKLVEVL
jgi:hypothetical protein